MKAGGSIKGNAHWPLAGKISTWETAISPAQLKLALQAFDAIKFQPSGYSVNMQCTGMTLRIANHIGVKLPDGIGPVMVRDVFGRTHWSGQAANPYHLSQQMQRMYGLPSIMNPSYFPQP